jgi:hypothetical protein
VARQAAKVNRGFTSTMSMAQRSDNGVPVPHLKNGSRDPCVQSAHMIASSILRQVTLPWLGRPITEDPDRQRFAGERRKYCGRKHHLHLGSNCAWHRDVHNPLPPHDDSTWVMNVSHAFAGDSMLAALFYQRSSVCSSLRASSIQDPLLEDFYSSYNGFAKDRRAFSRLSIPAYSNDNTDGTTKVARAWWWLRLIWTPSASFCHPTLIVLHTGFLSTLHTGGGKCS